MPTRTDATPEKKQLGNADEVLKLCLEFESELHELKVQYEQYFLGLERTAPTKRHGLLKKQITSLKNTYLRQTAAKFRVQQLQQKLTTYERLWDRTLKEMEAGTYTRDLKKARRHLQEREMKNRQAMTDVSQLHPSEAAPAVSPLGQLSAPTATAKTSSATSQNRKFKSIYEAYIAAKKRCGEDVKGVTLDSVATALRKQVPALIKQHQAKSVEFKVIIKDGKATLRALPKK